MNQKISPLIEYTKDGFVVNESAASIISSIQTPLAILVLAGPYRSGKSFLLSSLSSNVAKFRVGHSIKSCTKGIWCCTEPIVGHFIPGGEKKAVLLLDTEGLGATDASRGHDNHIFTLASLIASKLVYNSVGAIDEKSITKLSFVTELSKLVAAQGKKGGQISPNFFPSFTWILRDFSLLLKDSKGNEISPTQYMEDNLKNLPGFSKTIVARNKVCGTLRKFFTDRSCVTLVRPAEDESVLQDIEGNRDKLRPAFEAQVDNLRKVLLSNLRPKMLGNKELTGSGFISLVRSYVEAINQGAVPSVENAWAGAVRKEYEAAYEFSLSIHTSKIEEERKKLPLENDVIVSAQNNSCQEAFRKFDLRCGVKSETSIQLRNELSNRMEVEWKGLLDENEEKSKSKCESLLLGLFADFAKIETEERKRKEKNDFESLSLNVNDVEQKDDKTQLTEMWARHNVVVEKYAKLAIGPAKTAVLQRIGTKKLQETMDDVLRSRKRVFQETRRQLLNTKKRVIESEEESKTLRNTIALEKNK
eukprot:g718.t1